MPKRWGLGVWRARGGPGRCPHRSRCRPIPLTRSASTPETWAKFTQEHLYRAERERLASVNLRNLIDCILQDTSEDLRLQCDAVNLAFGRRCEELEDARHKLEHHLRKVGPRDCAQPAARPRPSRSQGPRRLLYSHAEPAARPRPGYYIATPISQPGHTLDTPIAQPGHAQLMTWPRQGRP